MLAFTRELADFRKVGGGPANWRFPSDALIVFELVSSLVFLQILG
jgi:hypothetical protein